MRLEIACYKYQVLDIFGWQAVCTLRCKTWIYSVFQEGCACRTSEKRSLDSFISNQKRLYSDLEGYGNTEVRTLWSSCGSTYCTCLAWCVTAQSRSVFEPTAKSCNVARVLSKVLGNITTIFMKPAQGFLTQSVFLCHSDVN